jgi:hypothetical protein
MLDRIAIEVCCNGQEIPPVGIDNSTAKRYSRSEEARPGKAGVWLGAAVVVHQVMSFLFTALRGWR